MQSARLRLPQLKSFSRHPNRHCVFQRTFYSLTAHTPQPCSLDLLRAAQSRFLLLPQKDLLRNSLRGLDAEAIYAHKATRLRVADTPNRRSTNSSNISRINHDGRVDRERYHTQSATLHITRANTGNLHLSGTTAVSN